MTWQRTRSDDPRRTFLVERYLSPAAALELETATERVRRLCAEADRGVSAVQYLFSAYLPAEDTCFCLFRAPSADAVRAVNDQGRFALDRLVDAVLMLGAETGTDPRRRSS